MDLIKIMQRGLKTSAATVYLILQRLGILLIIIFTGLFVYTQFIDTILGEGNRIISFLLAWSLTAYILLPRINRVLTKIYLPNYFIGRARTADGLLGDPVNIAVVGSEGELRAAMLKAGWTSADPLSLRNNWRIVKSSIAMKSYPEAPVSSLYVFGNMQDMAFQQEINNNPRRRHHVRFWKTPDGWIMPGGYKVDWVGAGTYDKRVGLSLFTFQITHKIAENTDDERDYIITSLQKHKALQKVRVIKDYSTGYHSRNGGGDSIITDGALPIVYL